ncbi:MAG: GntR family transcriptional regulator [Bacteroidales bacterium]|nr:GntR family transcriptional regulator [Bacteroidales bacterium]
MLKIGRYNHLRVNRLVDFGAYLDAGDDHEILMPAKYMDPDIQPGDEVDVFVYTDSEDRLVATTEHPFAEVGEFAYLQVADVNKVGAFMDWGLQAKQLLVPFSEQKLKMNPGCIYLVYVYLDDTTKRIVGSSKIEKYLGNVLPHYKRGDEVKALVFQHNALGYRCIVDNLHYGLIYQNELFQPLELETTIKAYVKQVREDGKIDLTVGDCSRIRTRDTADEILDQLQQAGGELPFSDKSDPDEIRDRFHCSKKDFKKALGKLYKEHRIELLADSIKAL